MLNEYNGYAIGIIAALASVIVYFKRHRKQNGMIGKCLLIILLVYYSTMYLTFVFFPMPVQLSVVESGFHETQNYLKPFSLFTYLYEIYVVNNGMRVGEFIGRYFAQVWALCTQIIPIGLLSRLLFKFNIKKFLIFSIGAVMGVELLKVICNLVTTVNYISLVFENMIYSIISLFFGYFLYYPVFWTAKFLRDKSNIMSEIYELIS